MKALVCPVCAGPLTRPARGKVGTYCSTNCRVAAHRSRRAAQDAHVYGTISAAVENLFHANSATNQLAALWPRLAGTERDYVRELATAARSLARRLEVLVPSEKNLRAEWNLLNPRP